MKKLPESYKGGTLTSSTDGSAVVSFHFSNTADAERWFNILTGEAQPAVANTDTPEHEAYRRGFSDGYDFGRAHAQPAADGKAGGEVAYIDRSDAVNLARNILESDSDDITQKGVRMLCDAVVRMDAAMAMPCIDEECPVIVTGMVEDRAGFLHCCINSEFNPLTKLYTRPQPQAIPAGYVWVPVEPTPEMMQAMVDPFIAVNGDNRSAFMSAYRAMLAAAPKVNSKG